MLARETFASVGSSLLPEVEQLRTYRQIAAVLSLIALGLALLASGCGPNLTQSLTDNITAFYAQVINGDDPYALFDVLPPWSSLPVASSEPVRAAVETVADRASDGKWDVRARLEISTRHGTVSMLEDTTWARSDNSWVLTGAKLFAGEFSGWSAAREIDSGLLAFEHAGLVWLIDTATGGIALLTGPETPGHAGDHPYYVDEWAPGGQGLVLYSEAAICWYNPAIGHIAKLADAGNYGGVTWSNDGSYGLLDWGTDVIRTVEVLDVKRGTVIGRVAAYTALWSPDGAIVIAKPETVSPEWPAGDGGSLSMAVVEIARDAAGASAIHTTNLVTGTSTSMYIPEGYGRDGNLYYRETQLLSGNEIVTWWRWDAATGQGIQQPSAPGIEPPAAPPTLQLPAQLGGPGTVRVEVSGDGRWGFFAATGDDGGSAIYLVDLTAPDDWEQVAAGSRPRWMTTGAQAAK